MIKVKLIFTFTLLFCILNIYSQVDREFWFAIPKETDAHCNASLNATYNISFKIAAMNMPATVTIEMPANPYFPTRTFLVDSFTSRIEVLADSWVEFDSIYSNMARARQSPLSGITNHGIHITADNDITVYYDYDVYWNRDLFSLKGKNALGTEFFTPFQNIWKNDDRNTAATGGCAYPNPQKQWDAYSSLDIVATEDGTVIDIYPTVIFQGRTNTATFSITLNRGQTYSLRAPGRSPKDHPTGTRIVSRDANKPIAVTINDDSVNGATGTCADILGDQLVPTSIIGTKYIVMTGNAANSFAGGTVKDIRRGDAIFVTATKPNTHVFFMDKVGNVLFDTIMGMGKSTYITPDRTIANQSSILVTSDDDSKPIYVFHSTGIGCELGGAILPPITDCTGSNEVTVFPGITGVANGSDTRITINIMIPYDKTKPFTDTTQSHYHFTLYNSKYPFPNGYHIPGSCFERDTVSGWAILKFNDRNFGPAGPFAKNVMVFDANRFTNTEDFFHLGMTNGTSGNTNKYGYFSSFNEARAEVRVESTEEKNYIGCYGNEITLVAKNGLEYTWHYGTPKGGPTYLSDAKSATPVVAKNCPVGSHIFYVEVRQAKCFGIDTLKVNVNILPIVTAHFEVSGGVCAPDTLHFTNKSENAQTYSWKIREGNGVEYGYAPNDSMNFGYYVDNLGTDSVLIHFKLIAESLEGCSDMDSTTITVYPRVSADFTIDDTIGCHPHPVQFTNNSQGNTGTYKWEFGDQGSSNDTNPAHIYTNYYSHDTTYLVRLIAKSPFYCTDTAWSNVTVHPFIEAHFATDTVRGCSPLNLTIQNGSLGAIDRYLWNYGNAPDDTSARNDTIYIYNGYSNTGNANITRKLKLSVFNAAGCEDSISRLITIYPQINAQFSATPTEGCTPLHVDFTNLSNPAATTFYWEFGDGSNSFDTVPSHDFVNLGLNDTTYTVVLKATTAELCPGYDTALITVRGEIIANFTIDSSAFCAPYSLRINNNSKGGDSAVYHWDFGDSWPDSITPYKTPPIWHTYYNILGFPRTDTITLTVNGTGNCFKTFKRPITVYPEVSADFAVDHTEGCNPLTVQFFNNSSSFGGTTYLWEYGDTTSSTQPADPHTFTNLSSTNKSFLVKLFVRNPYNCAAMDTQTITVYSYIEAGFAIQNAVGCSPLPVTVTDASRGDVRKWVWSVNDGQGDSTSSVFNILPVINTSSVVDSSRYVRLVVSNSNNCKSSVTRPLIIYPEIEAAFFTNPIQHNGCRPFDVMFINASSPAITDHLIWDFGDNSFATDPTAFHQFENTSKNEVTYKTKLYVHTKYNCTDSTETDITIYPFLETIFTMDSVRGCSPLTVNFTNASYPYSGANGYTWDFGEGAPPIRDLSPNMSYTYNNYDPVPKIINVTLTSDYNNICTDHITHTIEVFPKVTANFVADTTGCHPFSTQFTNLTTNAERYDWSFGDRGLSILPDPPHDYTNYGLSDSVYTVRLLATSTYNCSDQLSRTVIVHPKPKAKFQVDNSIKCPPFNVQITNKSEAGDFYHWSYGDGNSFDNTTLDTIYHEYLNPANDIITYPLVLTVQTTHNCSDTAYQDINVYPAVVAQFSKDSSGCSPLLMHFDNTSIRAEKYFWTFGDGSTSTMRSPSYPFYNSSVNDTMYTVTMIGTSKFNCTDTAVHYITIHPQPVARFIALPSRLYYPDATTNITNETNTGNWTYLWNFGEGANDTSTLKDPGQKIYNWWGDYYINLTAKSAYCEDSAKQKITIYRPYPVPDFSIANNNSCEPVLIQFTDLSIWADTYFWEFGDGTNSTERNPIHPYDTAGRYSVKLTVTGDNLQTYLYKDVYVFPKPDVHFDVAPRLVMLPDADVKMTNQTVGATRYLWDFGDEGNSSEFAPLHSYENIGLYTISLSAWSEHNCFDSLVRVEIVNVISEGKIKFPNAFTPSLSGPSDGRYKDRAETNDIFHPNWDGIDKFHMEIYTRWGVKLFETDDVNVGWDGYFNGKLCKADVYVYTGKGTYVDGTPFKFLGDVTLIR